ncbi:hypothetical protein [Borreliella garinii]|uniref:hypothetical protein n=1 Tax=Borreliella garinii TaxID=29519 RepID=UPI001AED53AD|nr:hypothetical protein [Borreliella garinii]
MNEKKGYFKPKNIPVHNKAREREREKNSMESAFFKRKKSIISNTKKPTIYVQ